MDVDIFHKVRNGLTEYSRNYRSVNPYIMMSYNGLPPFLSKLANMLFLYVIKTKIYGDNATSKGKNEDKRIYTDIELSISDLLMDFNPIKYSDGSDMEMDKSNMIKKIKELHDNNIFYYWKYNKRFLFVMEREIGCWRVFNENGCVVPKTLKKIVKLSDDMISCMMKFENKHGRADRKDIEQSFGAFMNKMINKMNPTASSQLTLWSDDKEVPQYLSEVSSQLKDMDEFEGMDFTDNDVATFLSKVPSTISKRMSEEIRQEDMKNKKQKEMEGALVPKNPNLVKKMGIKVKKERKEKPIEVESSSGPVLMRWKGEIDPLSDSLQFTKYYRHVLHSKTEGKVVFDEMSFDTNAASQILDLLIERNRDRDFLDSWIQYFYDNNLKGQKALKTKYTSLKCFKDTFESYNEKFHVPS